MISLTEEAVFPYRGNVSFNECFIPGNWISWLVQTICYIFSETPAGESFFFYLVETYFWTNPSFQLLEKDFFSLMETVTLLESFFSASGNRHCYEWKPIYKDRAYSCWWKLILWLILSFVPISWNAFFSPKGYYCFLFRALFPASENHYLNYRKAYLKPSLLLLAIMFFVEFFDFPINGNGFFRLIEMYS